jgi:L-alanine-DL-glutamate epimerase-like enolase superfamily enzyme
LAELRRASGLRLAGGEASTGLHEYRGMLEKGSLDIIQFEISVIGPTTARQVATLAAAYDKPCIAHVGFGPGVFCAGHFNASCRTQCSGPSHGTGPTWEVFFEPPALDIGQIWSVRELTAHRQGRLMHRAWA